MFYCSISRQRITKNNTFIGGGAAAFAAEAFIAELEITTSVIKKSDRINSELNGMLVVLLQSLLLNQHK